MKYTRTCEKCGTITTADTKEEVGYIIDEKARETNIRRLSYLKEMETKHNERMAEFEAEYKKKLDEAAKYNKKHNLSGTIPKVKPKIVKKNKDGGYTVGTISHTIELEQEVYRENSPTITFMSMRCIKCGVCGKTEYLDKDITIEIDNLAWISNPKEKYGIDL